MSPVASITPAMVAPAPLTAWWQMAERLVNAVVVMVGQAALGMRVDLELGMQFQRILRVEAAVALEIQGR